jgi:hypothetical protein
MTKQRKTRAQKLKAAARRSQPAIAKLAAAAPNPMTPKDSRSTAISIAKITPKSSPVGLKTSLWLLLGLIAVQFLVWLLFQLSPIDTKLYELLKL